MSTMVKRKRVVVDVYHGDRHRKRDSVQKKFRVLIGVLLAVVVVLTVIFTVHAMDNTNISNVNGNEYSLSEVVRKLFDINFNK